MRGEPVDDAAIAAEIAPAFLEQDGRRTDAIVLACTHYPFLLDRLERLAPWPVAWIDPAPAIARRVVAVVAVQVQVEVAEQRDTEAGVAGRQVRATWRLVEVAEQLRGKLSARADTSLAVRAGEVLPDCVFRDTERAGGCAATCAAKHTFDDLAFA